MDETRKTPRNQLDQPPTRTPQETALRLKDKQRVQAGRANRKRTEKKIQESDRP